MANVETASALSSDSIVATFSPPRRRPSTRPLRTYGRQPTTDCDTAQPVPKKRKLSRAEERPNAPPATKAHTRDSETVKEKENVEQLPRLPLPARGTILSFFKPVKAFPSLSSNSSACISLVRTSSDVVEKTEPKDPEPLATPPSSPPVLAKPRKRRRLTTRPDVGLLASSVTDTDESGEEGKGSGREGVAELVEARDETRCDALREVTPQSLNGSRTSERVAKKKPSKRAKKDMVQTTLNLRINPGPSYTICKDCELLYNPLNETDRKDHVRAHAAWRRNRQKAQQTQEAD